MRCCTSSWINAIHDIDNVSSSQTKTILVFLFVSPLKVRSIVNISSLSHFYPNTLRVDHSHAELWHFACTSKFGYVIQLSGISKGHSFYLFIWCLQCQCFLVQQEFFQGRCQGSGPLLELQKGLIGTINQFSSRCSAIFSACHCLLDLPVLIDEPMSYQAGCKITFPEDPGRDATRALWQAHRQQSKRKQLTKTADPGFLTAKLKSQNCSFVSLRFGFLPCTHPVCDYPAESSAVLHSTYLA